MVIIYQQSRANFQLRTIFIYTVVLIILLIRLVQPPKFITQKLSNLAVERSRKSDGFVWFTRKNLLPLAAFTCSRVLVILWARRS